MLLYAGPNSDLALDWARTAGTQTSAEREGDVWFVYLKSPIPALFEHILTKRQVNNTWRPSCARALFASHDGDADRPVLLPARMGLAPAYKLIEGFGLTTTQKEL